LIDRVARLLLAGADPSRILCITYTKAAAAEMSTRLFARLGKWSMAGDATLIDELADLGGPPPAREALDEARRLFARALETPGGLKIETIHAFCQRLMQRFPAEAKVPPEFEVIDEREAEGLLAAARQSVFHHLAGDEALRDAIALALDASGEHNFGEMLKDGIVKRVAIERFFAAADDGEGVAAHIRALLGLEAEQSYSNLERAIHAESDRFEDALRGAAAALSQGSDAEQERARAIVTYFESAERAEAFSDYNLAFFYKKGTRLKPTSRMVRQHADACLTIERECQRLEDWREKLNAAQIADLSIAALHILKRIFKDYEHLKSARRALDYDDLVAKALELLRNNAYAWVHFKLDGGIDHVLIDEAQDTSPDQWEIVRRLTAEFFALEAQSDERMRTMFAVGDQKQSIYSFQGADPSGFGRMRKHFEIETTRSGRSWAPTELEVSFRSAEEILGAVDKAFDTDEMRGALTAEASLVRHMAERVGERGLVELWPALKKEPKDESKHEDWTRPVDARPEAAPETLLSARVAKHIRAWLDRGTPLAAGAGEAARAIEPGDVLILVRQRGAMFYQMQRALNREGLPVAGSDRMMLHEETAYLDLDALARFCLMPADDLALAEVLKGPFIGLTDEDLLKLAPERKGSLWRALGEAAEVQFVAANRWLDHALDLSRRLRPYEFFESVLSGRVSEGDSARKNFVARLGRDAEDTIGEVLNLALEYERSEPASLQGFLAFMKTRADMIKRDMEKPDGRIRVMTVHGAKGLEAPVVFLIDTCSVPAAPKSKWMFGQGAGLEALVPVLRARKDERDPVTASLARDEEDRQRAEYHRQLYVAMTRARDRLYIAGVASPRAYAGSWHQTLTKTLEAMPGVERIGKGEETILRLGEEPQGEAARARPSTTARELPSWAFRMPLSERAPVRRTPSGLLPSEEAGLARMAPLSSGKDPFLRGSAIHKLLQLLPEMARERRAQAAMRLLSSAPYDALRDQHESIVAEVMRLFDDAEFARVFGPDSRAEVPIAGVLSGANGEQIIVSGQIDRLLVTPSEILIVDFKTNRPPAKSREDVPRAYHLQMAAYAQLLKAALPGRTVKAALLYTTIPRLISLDIEGIDVTQVTAP
ncbi:MAG TPA: double-strand break repair helicase AddA, partial [Alphaproteobacteria bacterium]|nr:double-strand break repair helicase AddA [Alphaproteobacteria bacterium]